LRGPNISWNFDCVMQNFACTQFVSMACVTHLARYWDAYFIREQYLLWTLNEYMVIAGVNNKRSIFPGQRKLMKFRWYSHIWTTFRTAIRVSCFFETELFGIEFTQSSFDRRYQFRTGVNIRSLFCTYARSIIAYFRHRYRFGSSPLSNYIIIGIPVCQKFTHRMIDRVAIITYKYVHAKQCPDTYDSYVHCMILDNVWITSAFRNNDQLNCVVCVMYSTSRTVCYCNLVNIS